MAIVSGAIACSVLAGTVVTVWVFPFTMKYDLSDVPIDWDRCSDQDLAELIQEGLGEEGVVRLGVQHDFLVVTGSLAWQIGVSKILSALRSIRC